jgi:hypothetical protein
MSKALSIVEPQEIAKVTQKDLDDYLFGTGTKLTEPQKRLFFGIALAQNLNPLKREIYAVAYGTNFNIITAYEVYLKRAERTGLLDGWEATVTGQGNDMVATCTIWRKNWSKPVSIQAWFPEYNTGQSLWKTKPRTMLRKVAIAQAFRMAFPDEVGGLPYTADELNSGEPQELSYTPLDKLAEKTADEDLEARAMAAVAYLKKKGKSRRDAMNYLDKDYDLWTQEDLDSLKTWAKAGFPAKTTSPELAGEEIPGEAVFQTGTSAEVPTTDTTESQGPDMGETLTRLAAKGWPLEKLEIKFNKKADWWGDRELSMLADMDMAEAE